MKRDVPLLLVGGGKMGGALLAGWLARGTPPERIAVVEPGAVAATLTTKHGVAVHPDLAALPARFRPEVVIFAVKPQVMDAAVPPYQHFAGPETLFLSIAAGKTIGYFLKHLGAAARIVRAMPNTPAAVGRGMSVCCAGPGVAQPARELATALLEAVGEVAWVEDEALIDAVTAVSGGGPAWRRRGSRPGCRRHSPRRSHALRSRAAASFCSSRRSRPRSCVRT
jgi:pyrroline-5-carboxylate reductase